MVYKINNICILLLVILFAICCTNVSVVKKYRVFSFQCPNQVINVYGEYLNNKEHGKFVVLSEGREIMKGQYENGFRKGEWVYGYLGGKKIDWTIFEDSLIETNYPSDWNVITPKGKVLFIANTTEQEGLVKNYFTILKHDLNYSSVEYRDYYKQEIYKLYNISGNRIYKFKTNKNTYLFAEYYFTLKDSEEELVLINMVCKHQGSIFYQ